MIARLARGEHEGFLILATRPSISQTRDPQGGFPFRNSPRLDERIGALSWQVDKIRLPSEVRIS
jgi:hypothetical protein